MGSPGPYPAPGSDLQMYLKIFSYLAENNGFNDMKTGWKGLWAACLLGCLAAVAGAQERKTGGIPDDVYYLMPAFGQGMVYFEGQAPAQGQMNICAADNSLRFLDKDGQELVAGNIDNVVRVVIDGVVFLRDNGAFFRLYPVTMDSGVAFEREVKVVRDAKQGAYGTTSQTSSTREVTNLYDGNGIVYNLGKTKDYPYNVYETVFLYKGNDVLSFTRKNLRKLFPSHKDEIDAYCKANKLPGTVPEALELLAGWAEE